MLKGHNEIRIIWLMLLVMLAVSAWFYEIKIVSYLCGLTFVISVMHYVDDIQMQVKHVSDQVQFEFQPSSKVPLYLASIAALVGIGLHWQGLLSLSLTVWIFFFLRWLRRLEFLLRQVQGQLQQVQSTTELNSPLSQKQSLALDPDESIQPSSVHSLGLLAQLKQWLFQGNPVLKVASVVLLIGIILLLRFATEHWQLSLLLKLSIVALISAGVTVLGYVLGEKNRGFALAVQGLGFAGLFLTLFFAYYNQVIVNFGAASLIFVFLMAVMVWLSLKQQSIELAVMAMLIAAIAPFTLPSRQMSAVELLAYYFVMNSAIAILSSLRPWKILNQIAFLLTVGIAGSYGVIYAYAANQHILALWVVAHSAIFIWLSFRFSQLIAQQDLAQFKLKPVLDLALIFAAPLVAYLFLYFIYFNQIVWQASLSALFAVLYLLLYQLAQRYQLLQHIAQSYLSLALIFMVLIPPILLPDQWSVIGWALQGLMVFIYALCRASNIARYLAMALLLIAGLLSIYYLAELAQFPRLMYGLLSLSYFSVVLFANSRMVFRRQLGELSLIFLALLQLAASMMLLMLLLDYVQGSHQYSLILLLMSVAYVGMNELMIFYKADRMWWIPKWLGVLPLYVLALILVLDRSQVSGIVWESGIERLSVAISGFCLLLLWLRPTFIIAEYKEWISFGGLLSLAFMGLSLFPAIPSISLVVLPLLFCGYSFLAQQHAVWKVLWQTRSSLVLVIIWIFCSPLFSEDMFYGYYLPILNPFDLISLLMWLSFAWMLTLQLKIGLDKGIIALLSVLSLLWLSSYILLRALHLYFATPYNTLALWQNALVQVSLTLLWVSLAFIAMSWASRQQLRSLWILGSSILIVVTLKLILFDLSHIGTLTRVISFLGAGLIMLLLAYIAPIPEIEQKSSV